MSAPIKADSARLRVWRYVRDMGKAGVSSAKVHEHLSGFDQSVISQALWALKSENFVHHAGRGKPYCVNEDCRVPAGESSLLGPGWDERDDDALTQKVVITGRSAPAPLREAVLAAAPNPEGSGIRLPASHRKPVADVGPIPQLGAAAVLPGFEAWISSADMLGIHSSDGPTIELSLPDARLLYAWLERVGPVVLAASHEVHA